MQCILEARPPYHSATLTGSHNLGVCFADVTRNELNCVSPALFWPSVCVKIDPSNQSLKRSKKGSSMLNSPPVWLYSFHVIYIYYIILYYIILYYIILYYIILYYIYTHVQVLSDCN